MGCCLLIQFQLASDHHFLPTFIGHAGSSLSRQVDFAQLSDSISSDIDTYVLIDHSDLNLYICFN